jgi:hypothetical protein
VTVTQPKIPTSSARPEPSRPRRWVVVVTVVWLLVLGVAGFIAARKADPTARDLTTVAAARHYVDEAVARVADAATADGQAVVAVSGFERVGECDVSVVRGGDRYRRGLTAIVAPGTEAAFLQRVASHLPAAYGTTVRTGSAPRLVADAGYWVTLTGAAVSPGEVRFNADTGDCRVAGDISTVDVAGSVDRTSALAALERLGLTATDWTESAVQCPGGGILRTVTAVAPAFAGALDARLRDLPDAVPVVTAPKLYAYRGRSTGVSVRARDDAVIVTATGSC